MFPGVGRCLGAALLAFALLWLIADLKSRKAKAITADTSKTELIYFKPHGLENVSLSVEVATLYLRAVDASPEIGLIENIDVRIPQFRFLNEEGSECLLRSEPKPVNVPRSTHHADASKIVFGVATDLERLEDSLMSFAHWAADTNATIIALVPPTKEKFWPFNSLTRRSPVKKQNVLKNASQLKINLVIRESKEPYIPRYVSLLQVLHDACGPLTQWVSIIDDDTFFLSMPRLLRMLDKYDASKPHYIGGLTEDVGSLQMWGILAYGGAGSFFSVPLLEEVVPHIPRCIAFDVPSGDGKVAECIYKFTTTKMSIEDGLNQLDLHGDQSGFYEAVRELPISVHHWKSWAHYDMVTSSAIAAITGQESIFQKYHLQDDWWMTHGFSMTRYREDSCDRYQPPMQDEPDAERIRNTVCLTHRQGAMERTFDHIFGENEKTLLYSLAPIRPKDEGKVQYLIESAVREDDQTMSLYYVRRNNGTAESIIRVVWTKGP